MSIDQRLKNADEIELLCSQGMTYAEIAEKLGIAESTVWRRRDQGRKIRRKAAAKPRRSRKSASFQASIDGICPNHSSLRT